MGGDGEQGSFEHLEVDRRGFLDLVGVVVVAGPAPRPVVLLEDPRSEMTGASEVLAKSLGEARSARRSSEPDPSSGDPSAFTIVTPVTRASEIGFSRQPRTVGKPRRRSPGRGPGSDTTTGPFRPSSFMLCVAVLRAPVRVGN